MEFCNVYNKLFSNDAPKIIYCPKTCIPLIEEGEINEVIKNYHTGKTNDRGITETVNQIRSKYYILSKYERENYKFH